MSVNEGFWTKFGLWFWRLCWVLFGLSFFTSKSGLSIFGALLFLNSLFIITWPSFLKQRWLAFFAASVPLGMFLNLFSLGGWQSSLSFFIATPWPLMVVPGYALLEREKDLPYFLWALVLSLSAALFNSFYIFHSKFNFIFTSGVRVASFFDIGRWGQFVATAAIFLMILVYPGFIKSKKGRLLATLLFVFSVISLILSNTRGPWLGFAVSAILVVIAMWRYWRTSVAILVLALLPVLMFDGFHSRIKSIMDVKKSEEGVITSGDSSNAARLHMWKVSVDRFEEHPFFGTGYGNTEGPLREFLSNQTEEYRRDHLVVGFSYNDAHSSYLHFLMEMGVLFSIYLWIVVIGFLIAMVSKYLKEFNYMALTASAGILLNLIIFVFYSSYSTYESVLIALLFVVGVLGACSDGSNRSETV